MKQQHILKTAPEVWKCLKGICCLYKPPRLSLHNVNTYISSNLSNELNQMKYFSPEEESERGLMGPDTAQISKTCPDYTYHPLVLGDLYAKGDFSFFFLKKMPWFMSGICVMGIGEESFQAIESLRKARLMGTYAIEGKLGVATRNFFYTGAAVERTPCDRVTVARLERALYKIQSHHQRKLVNQLGLPLNSQAAYEVLSQGLTRPCTDLGPVIHGIKVTEFARPHFSLEVTGTDIDGNFLLSLVNDLGLMVRSSAHAIQVRCIRQGAFTLDKALVRKHWRAEHIINNINECRPLVSKQTHEHVHLTSLADFQSEQRQHYEQKLLESKKLLEQRSETLKFLEEKPDSKTNVNRTDEGKLLLEKKE